MTYIYLYSGRNIRRRTSRTRQQLWAIEGFLPIDQLFRNFMLASCVKNIQKNFQTGHLEWFFSNIQNWNNQVCGWKTFKLSLWRLYVVLIAIIPCQYFHLALSCLTVNMCLWGQILDVLLKLSGTPICFILLSSIKNSATLQIRYRLNLDPLFFLADFF